VRARWHAAIDAGLDMVATDQYKDLAGLLRPLGPSGDYRTFTRPNINPVSTSTGCPCF
jgi:hypothetical protein